MLLEDYAFFAQDPELFCQRLSVLTAQKGKVLIGQWQDMVRAGQTPAVVSALLEQHYDPTYAKSVERNFTRFGQAHVATLKDRHPSNMADMAAQLCKRFP